MSKINFRDLSSIAYSKYLFINYTGNLESRTFQKPGSTSLSESFTYDNMDRLLSSQVGQNPVISCNYLTNGNISTKTDLGTYTYDPGRKNAVTSLSGSYANALDTITYNAFNLTSGITQGSNGLQIIYGPDNMRIKTILTENQSVRTKYFSPGYEKDSTSTGVKQIHYISSPYGLEAVLIKQGQNVTTYFAETDYLGSIIGLMNPGGTYAEQFSFDAWGRRRNPTNWTYANVPSPTLTERGYTGHEHLDRLGLINMNGRMYDPVLGRFLSVDPVVRDMGNSQSMNGYSYCVNNPLKYSDPSGYAFQTMKDLYYGVGSFYYRGGIYSMGEDGWEYYQPTLNGLMSRSSDISYGALNQDPFHEDSRGNVRDSEGRIVYYSTQRGRRGYGHWERVEPNQYGAIHSIKVNNSPDDPNKIDNLTVTEKWIWDLTPLGPNAVLDNNSAVSKWWFEPIDFITTYLVGLDILGKSLGISNLPYLGKAGFFVQGIKSLYEVNTGPHGKQAYNSGTDLAASFVGTYLGFSGFIGGVNYLIIDKTIGIENYALGFIESINLYGQYNNPVFIRSWTH